MLKSQTWNNKILSAFCVKFHLVTVITNMTYTTKSSACLAGAFKIFASS